MQEAESLLGMLCDRYRDTALKLAAWAEENIPEGLAVFELPSSLSRIYRKNLQKERCITSVSDPGDNEYQFLANGLLLRASIKFTVSSNCFVRNGMNIRKRVVAPRTSGHMPCTVTAAPTNCTRVQSQSPGYEVIISATCRADVSRG